MNCPVCGHVLSGERCEGCGARRGRHRIPLSGQLGPKGPRNWKLLAISIGVAVVVAAVFFAIMAAGGENYVRNQQNASGAFGDEVILPPGKSISYVITVMFSSSYVFTVSPIDGPVIMAVGRIDAGEHQKMDPDDIDRALEGGVQVEAGKSHTLTGPMDRGRYTWAVSNPTGRKVRVKISFQ
jgi:hypothetical protein